MKDVVDAHVHVWDVQRIAHPWLTDGSELGSRTLPANIDDAGGAVTDWVFVETDVPSSVMLAEARWVNGLHWRGLRAIVAAADLGARDLAERLDELASIPRVRGVRHLLQNQPLDVFSSNAYVDGLVTLGRRGLTFDACVRWPQLGPLRGLLARAPDTAVVLDHLGKPPMGSGLASEAGSAWRGAMRRLADLPHLAVKLSGLPAETPAGSDLRRDGAGFLSTALDLFGPERCLFGTDWPISMSGARGVGATDWLALVRSVAGDDQNVFGDSARRLYSFDARPAPGG